MQHRFNSKTGRAALGARGGHARARQMALDGYAQGKANLVAGVRTRRLKALSRQTQALDCYCNEITGLRLIDWIVTQQGIPQ